jgi:predicted nucleotidyltransferase component of viral defense system
MTFVDIMIKIPLQTKLKREAHRKIAYAQDLVVKEVYSVFNHAVLHGGTAIWRCYGGLRFSEDLDFYLPNNKEKIEFLFENLKKCGFVIKKEKISETSVYAELELDRVSVRLEATYQNILGVICDYEMSDGNIFLIFSLTPESFISEKAITYLKRLKIRDLWDVFFLLKLVDSPEKIKEIDALIKNFEKPKDEENLKVILLEGIIPSANEMISYVRKKWENKYI